MASNSLKRGTATYYEIKGVSDARILGAEITGANEKAVIVFCLYSPHGLHKNPDPVIQKLTHIINEINTQNSLMDFSSTEPKPTH